MADGKKSSGGRGRTRNYATVVYPESAPANWRDILEQQHVAVLISPLHDKDTLPDGSSKKAHYHVLVMYDGVKSWEQVQPLFLAIGGVGREIVSSARGYARYLCHLDSPDKHQYDPADIVAMGGADYKAITHLPTDDIAQMQAMQRFIRANQICSFAEFLDICADYFPEWYATVAMSRAYVIDKYIKGRHWEIDAQYQRRETLINPDTGEVISSPSVGDAGTGDATGGESGQT